MGGRVVYRKAIPQPSTNLFPKAVGQRLTGVGAQIVDDQMNGVCCRIVRGDLQNEIGKLGDERVGVTLVNCTPALGSIPQKTFAVPQRSYS